MPVFRDKAYQKRWVRADGSVPSGDTRLIAPLKGAVSWPVRPRISRVRLLTVWASSLLCAAMRARIHSCPETSTKTRPARMYFRRPCCSAFSTKTGAEGAYGVMSVVPYMRRDVEFCACGLGATTEGGGRSRNLGFIPSLNSAHRRPSSRVEPGKEMRD
ncbi:hypothetical protein OH77DRAFT_365459 [Trametes cingulata]|nr:hypothetical protein OH77DRAFT_365459 [Trametes cingulata]